MKLKVKIAIVMTPTEAAMNLSMLQHLRSSSQKALPDHESKFINDFEEMRERAGRTMDSAHIDMEGNPS